MFAHVHGNFGVGASLSSLVLTNSDTIGNDDDNVLNVNTNDNVKKHWSITKHNE